MLATPSIVQLQGFISCQWSGGKGNLINVCISTVGLHPRQYSLGLYVRYKRCRIVDLLICVPRQHLQLLGLSHKPWHVEFMCCIESAGTILSVVCTVLLRCAEGVSYVPGCQLDVCKGASMSDSESKYGYQCTEHFHAVGV